MITHDTQIRFRIENANSCLCGFKSSLAEAKKIAKDRGELVPTDEPHQLRKVPKREPDEEIKSYPIVWDTENGYRDSDSASSQDENKCI